MAEPTITTIKKLFALSSNRCAFPGCQNRLFDASGALIARVCHICADRPGGKRYDPTQTEAERQGFENLIVLCANHHIVVDDDEVTYSAPVLHEMKRRHEQSCTEPLIISDQTAERIIMIMAAGAAGAGVGELVREIADFARALANAFPPAAEEKNPPDDRGEKLLRELEDILRYAPKGHISYYSRDATHLRVGTFFADVFRRSGWREVQPNLNTRFISATGSDYELDRAMVLMFMVRDVNQVPNTRRTLDQVFVRCGFRPVDDPTGETNYRSQDGAIHIFMLVGVFH